MRQKHGRVVLLTIVPLMFAFTLHGHAATSAAAAAADPGCEDQQRPPKPRPVSDPPATPPEEVPSTAQTSPLAVVPDANDSWTLAELGFEPIQISPSEMKPSTAGGSAKAVRALVVDLPANSSQGPTEWWTLGLQIRSVLSPSSEPGIVRVSASTNGYATSHVAFTRQSDGTTTVEKINLLDGVTTTNNTGRTIDTRYENYLQLRGVKGGPNLLTFSVESFGGPLPDSVIIEDTSFLSRSADSPMEPILRADSLCRHIRAGDTFAVSLYPSGGVRRASVRLLPANGGLSSQTPNGSTVPGKLHLKALKVGTFDLRVRVTADGRRPRSMNLGSVVVEPPRRGQDPSPILIGGLLLASLLGAIWLRKRSSRRAG